MLDVRVIYLVASRGIVLPNPESVSRLTLPSQPAHLFGDTLLPK